MPKTYDEKREAFQSMLDKRLPKASHAIGLLRNLSRKADYAWTQQELQTMLDELDDAVDSVAQSFGAGVAAAEPKTGEADVVSSASPESMKDGIIAFAEHAGFTLAPWQVDVLRGISRDFTAGLAPRPVEGHDRAAIKAAYLQIAKGDKVHGLKALRSVILGWNPEEKD